MTYTPSIDTCKLQTLLTRRVWVLLVLFLVCVSFQHQSAGQTVNKLRMAKTSVTRSGGRVSMRAKSAEQKQMAILIERINELSRKLESAISVEAEDARQRRIDELEKRLAETEKRLAVAEQIVLKLPGVVPSGEPVVSLNEGEPDVQQGGVGAPKRREQVEDAPAIPQQQDVLRPTGDRQRLRFYGDFRLRADGILRPALTDPAPSQTALPHEQNIRARYRLRLNFDADINPSLRFHGQLSTGPSNDPLTADQDFTAITTRHPIAISEAWLDYEPKKWLQLQGGRVQNIFADNSRFLFDDDLRFNGFNEKVVWTFKPNPLRTTSIEARAGQYFFSNPTVAIVTEGSPLAEAGAVVGSTGRSANLFHQGVLVNQQYNEAARGQFAADLQLYRNPNQIQLASTPEGVPIIVQNGLGITLSGPLPGIGNATTTPNGAIYTAPSFKIVRLGYWLSLARPIRAFFNLQVARNVGIDLKERDSLLAFVGVGAITKPGDQAVSYIFSIKGANSLISQLTDNDLGTGSGANVRVHYIRYQLGLSRRATLQSLFFIQNELRNSDPSANFFVPLNAFTPRQYRFQQQLVISF